jgi:hypothetical protein
MKILSSKWTLLGCVVVLAVIVTVRWNELAGTYRYLRMKIALKAEVGRINHALNNAGIPIGLLSYSLKGGIELRLEGSHVASISSLASLRVNRLALRDTMVTDISPLEGPHMLRLDLRGTPVTNFAAVTKMPNLDKLILSRRQILENLELLRGLKVFVGEDDTTSVLPGGIAWSNKYEHAIW